MLYSLFLLPGVSPSSSRRLASASMHFREVWLRPFLSVTQWWPLFLVSLHSCFIQLPFSLPWAAFAAHLLSFCTSPGSSVDFSFASLPFSSLLLPSPSFSFPFGQPSPFSLSSSAQFFVYTLPSLLWPFAAYCHSVGFLVFTSYCTGSPKSPFRC